MQSTPFPRRFIVLALPLLPALALPADAQDATPFEVRIAIKNHRFEPSEVEVPAGRKIKLIVVNEDPTPEEFESVGLKVERVIPGGKTAEFLINPLRKNRNYGFFGEFHQDTAKGRLVVK
ncbi:MAG: cupredoxin domain-containing protein [Reyranellaceae bacterium]